MSLRSCIAQHGGVARACELAAAGYGPGALRAAVAAGELVRPRKGWYVDGRTPTDLVRCIRVGGAATCVSAARALGLWLPGDVDARVHVAVAPTAARLRTPDDRRRRLVDEAVVHWSSRSPRLLAPVEEIVRHVVRCFGAAAAFAVLESAVHGGAVEASHARTIGSTIASLRSRSGLVTSLSESGSESHLKLLLDDLGLSWRQQVPFPGVGRVDFLVGPSLVVEADSRAHHSDPTADRRRDAVLSARGIRTLRFMYSQIVHEPDEVRAAITGAVLRGDAGRVRA